ncbi:TPA: type II toxin-antitoxin system PemK/MazF family toxin [Klebsiella oxytoca]|uniref:Type II toxin-antitoxin system PemK/MazF family toxin n=1 Tax=Klebsiella oxytoca TaxID=571 RepID=A0AAN5RDC7_KLEOX|nr:type II toxin-antitoxin system PemK/MazF family toxin [Klebsiella oxytoca]
MAITFHPRVGQILLCDFCPGFKEPEMIKAARPVIVLSGHLPGRGQLITVVACSTKEPEIIRPYHYMIPSGSMPPIPRFREKDTWVKGDMVYTVGFHRLNLIQTGKDHQGKRLYFSQCLGKEQINEIRRCVLHGLGMSFAASIIK